MPIYTVRDVLDIIKNFTPDEKSQLQAQLPSVMGVTTTASPQEYQSQSVGNVNMRDSNNIAFTQTKDGNVDLHQNAAPTSVKNSNLQEALTILQKLKQDVNQSNNLNELQKTTAEANIKFVEKEISKPKPDKSLIDQGIEALKAGLSLANLVEPVTIVAELVAKVWGI